MKTIKIIRNWSAAIGAGIFLSYLILWLYALDHPGFSKIGERLVYEILPFPAIISTIFLAITWALTAIIDVIANLTYKRKN